MLHQLKSFVTTSRLESVSLAAKKLFLTQPAVTQHIRQLEDHFKKKLIARSGNKMRLTPEGEKLFLYADDLLLRCDSVDTLFSSDEDKVETIKFATIDSATLSILPGAIRKFLQKAKKVSLEPHVCSSGIAYGKLFADEIDLAICTFDHIPAGLAGDILFPEELIFIGSKDHVKIKNSSELQREKFIIFPKTSMVRDLIDHSLKRLSITPNILLENIKMSAIVPFVEAGLGVSLVPYYSVKRDLVSKRVFKINIASGVKRTVGIAYKKGKIFSSSSLLFINLLKGQAKVLYSKNVPISA